MKKPFTRVIKSQLIKELIDHMWDAGWFDNRNTHGTYTEPDFKESLECMELSELKALRQYQIENLSDELFYEHVWNGDTITYKAELHEDPNNPFWR